MIFPIRRGPLVAVSLLLHALASRAQDPPQKPASVPEGFAQLPGVRIWFNDSGGKGVPVVLLHAGTGNVRMWEKQFGPLTAAGFRVIAYDRRGWGRSVTQTNAPQPGTAVEDLDQLMNYLKVDRFHLVGTAAGGIVALDYALSRPEKLRSLVIACSIGGISDEEFQRVGRRIRPAQLESLPVEFRELGPTFRAAEPEGTQRWTQIEQASRLPGATAQPLRNKFTYAAIESIRTPTLVIAGGADLYAPPPLMRQISDRIKGAQMATIPDAGHSAYWETPEAFNRLVLEFITIH